MLGCVWTRSKRARRRWAPHGAAPRQARFLHDDEPVSGPGGQSGPAGTETLDDADRDWKSEYVREVAQSRKYRQRAQRAETQFEEFAGRTLAPEQIEEYHKLRLTSEEMASKDRRMGQLEGMVRRVVGAGELTRALVSFGVGSRSCYGEAHGQRMLTQATGLLAGRVRVDLDEDEPRVCVLDDAGEPLADEEGRPVAVQDFVAAWLAEEGGHFLPPSGDTGSGAHKGGIVSPSVSVEQLDRNPRAKAEFIARHGPQAYVQLAKRRK